MTPKRHRTPVEPTTFPCDSCRQSKIKCDHQKPCSHCVGRGRECAYTAYDESGRLRKFHKRSRNGCQKCKTRRVRCDEVRPVCTGCVRLGLPAGCIFPHDDESVWSSGGPQTPLESTSTTPVRSSRSDSGAGPVATAEPAGSAGSVSGQPDVRPQLGTAPSWDFEALLSGAADFAAAVPAIPPNPLAPTAPLAFTHQQVANPTAANIEPSLADLTTYILGEAIPDGTSRLDKPPRLLATADEILSCVGRIGPLSEASSSPADHTSWQLVAPETTRYTAWPGIDNQLQDAMVPFGPATIVPANLMLAPLHQPDALACYFVTPEQRQQYRHFFTETVNSLVVVPTSPAYNPWLCRLSAMALGPAFGQEAAYDALRYAILSLASLDIGFRIYHSLANRNENAMYATSLEQRQAALRLARMCQDAGCLEGDTADLLLGTALAISFRDRLSGSYDWEEPLKIAGDIISAAGGPAAFIAQRSTPHRRYLVEQMACVEITALLTTFEAAQIVSWENDWLDVDPTYEQNDSLHVVFGWDRASVKMGAQAVMIADEFRRIELLRGMNKKNGYRQFRDNILLRSTSLRERCIACLQEAAISRNALMMTPVPAQVTLCALAFRASLELFIDLMISGSLKMQTESGQRKVETILELADEGIARGMHAGMMLPLSWAAAFAGGDNIGRTERLLEMLVDRYHLEPKLLDRLVHVDWTAFEGVALEDWNTFLKATGLFVPLF